MSEWVGVLKRNGMIGRTNYLEFTQLLGIPTIRQISIEKSLLGGLS